ncbi:ABC transporter permease [Compostimonas suwonensis]|uniref:Peptide/nickel transport system permease protein n=1 Tax=Compostimonas suwonensis TaxID=1048394 RepID=A0A2M9BZF0_9MICO|nr:ABC transporter permease [Compostimonas suwonensis]PJJ63463.1 peptide/nickel transport system permease protein [Compostimonas suwonensis]
MRLSRIVGVALAALALLVLGLWALAPQWFTAHDPVQTDLAAAFLPPSAEHLFGTDQSGRDVFARVVYGARYSLGVGVGATAIAVTVGLLLGSLSGLAPRVVDTVLMRGVDVIMAFPEFLLALVVLAVLGPGPVNVVLAVTVAAIPAYVRLVRGQTLSVREADYVEAATVLGLRRSTVVLRHVVPNTAGPVLVLATIGIGTCIVAAAGLSFLGLGATEPTPEWGLILAGGRNFLGRAWWIAVFPGLAITITVVAATTIGRALQARAAGRRLS